jgi:hypothetical protein
LQFSVEFIGEEGSCGEEKEEGLSIVVGELYEVGVLLVGEVLEEEYVVFNEELGVVC